MGRVYVKVRFPKVAYADVTVEENLGEVVFIPHGRVKRIEPDGIVDISEDGEGILVGWREGDDPKIYIEREGIDAKS